MCDIETLGGRVRGVVADLPVTDAREAASTLAQAHAGMVTALRDSVEPAGTGELARAVERLDAAVRQLNVVADELDGYLVDIGVPPGRRDARENGATTGGAPVAGNSGGSEDWWRQRVNEITEGDSDTEPGDVTLTRLFSDLVDDARRGDRDDYRRRLLLAGAQHGCRLPGLSWPMLRGLVSDVLGRPAGPRDDDRLRSITREPLAKMLPKLPEGVALSQLRGACSLPDDGDHHPADTAAVGPIMVAALLRERERTRKDTLWLVGVPVSRTRWPRNSPPPAARRATWREPPNSGPRKPKRPPLPRWRRLARNKPRWPAPIARCSTRSPDAPRPKSIPRSTR